MGRGGGPLMPAPSASSSAALAVTRLSHAFGPRRVLDDVTFNIQPGDFSVLLGLNGAGKTTLFGLITRLYHSKSGHIAVLGHDMRREPGRALARMGAVFQQSTLDLDLTVLQNLTYHAALHGMPSREARERAMEELGRIGLADRAGDRVRQLSGGQRRRVELARALVHAPSLLLLDEPTVGLDIESRRFLLQHVRELCRDHGLAVLWATHLIDEADEQARIIVLHQGKVLAQGARDTIVRDADAADLGTAFDRLTRNSQNTTREKAA
ncbi:Daunorubicin resistance ATP-binding protein drrA [Granulibacter bethesdensis CGDNIH4]|nr:Daunorubicin resistance ATP-binding protein drrA [Granulibacter bethesdensis CGDNIH4]